MQPNIFNPGECYAYPLIVKKLLNTPLIYAPDQEIVYRDRLRYTYRDLNERIHRLAGGLEMLGVTAGETVAVFDYDSNRFLECLFAIPMMGAVMQMVNWRLSVDQILYTLNHSQARAILINADFLPLLSDMRDRLSHLRSVVVISEAYGPQNISRGVDTPYEQLLADAPAWYDFPDLDENTRATIFYTTGTTGDPKGVHFSHRQLMLHTLSLALTLGCYDNVGLLRSGDVYMPITPMFHVHGWGIPYVATLLGVRQVYPGRYAPEMLLKLIVDEAVTFSHCVPTILRMLFSSPAIKGVDLSRWKLIIGGSALSRDLARKARDMGITFYTGYGMSEACAAVTLAPPKHHMSHWDADRLLEVVCRTGLPIPLAEIEIMDSSNQPLPHDGKSTGEVVLRAPWLTRSYFRAPDKSADLWRGGWMHSGDVGLIDEEGYLKVTDRIKDVIKSGGEWVSSIDLENLMNEHEAVQESAAIAVPHEKWIERPLMLVVPNPAQNSRVTEADLRAHMLQAAADGRLPKYGVPERYRFVDEIPKTSVGKLDKKEMRRRWGV